MPGVYSSTTQGLEEKNSQGLQSLFQTPSFGSRGSFLIQSLYLQLCGYSRGWDSLPGANKPWNDRAWAPLCWRRTTAAPRCHSSPAPGLWTKDEQSHSTESSHTDPSSWAAWASQGQKITLLRAGDSYQQSHSSCNIPAWGPPSQADLNLPPRLPNPWPNSKAQTGEGGEAAEITLQYSKCRDFNH